MKIFLLSLLAAALAGTSYSRAQTPQGPAASDPLYKTVLGLDTALFDAYNNCQLDKLGSLVDEDLEFYHDKTGLAVGREPFLDAIKNNICGKVHRELVPGTLEVYPIDGYGAVELGVHRFTHPNDPKNLGEAKFIMLWQINDATWRITRVISFDHQSASP